MALETMSIFAFTKDHMLTVHHTNVILIFLKLYSFYPKAFLIFIYFYVYYIC